MKLQIFTVDAFSDKPFAGNQAAIVPLLAPLQEQTLQKVAAELNISETAFVIPEGHVNEPWLNASQFTLRWFTPTNEVPLCGHATLATAHVLFNELGNTNSKIEFKTLSGLLAARREDVNIVLDFPANPPGPLEQGEMESLKPLIAEVIQDLPLESKSICLSRTVKKLLVKLDSQTTRNDLENLKPNLEPLMKLHDGSLVKGIIVTIDGELKGEIPQGEEPSGTYHCYSRYFAPWNGIPEDPVTGSAHTVLGPFYSKRLGTNRLMCRQCSPRGGDLLITVRDDGRVDIAGRATTVIQGHISVQ